jgi:N-acetylmuramoyl-L-alanine amidase
LFQLVRKIRIKTNKTYTSHSAQVKRNKHLAKILPHSIALLCFLLIFSPLVSFVPYSFTYAPSIGIKKVVIDAGHGGKDAGAVGINGLKEKDVVLDVSLKLGELINKNFPDVEVIYTRKTDVFIELFERARIANKHNADLFISVHANSATNSTAYGTETFALGLHKSQANLDVAKKENSVILMEESYEINYEGFDPNSDESYIALTLRQNIFLDQSLNIASKIQDEFTKLGRKNRGVKQAGFLVLSQATMPSVLLEVGFLSHREEAAYLASKQNIDKITFAIFEAFTQYKHEIEKKSDFKASTKDELIKKEEEKKHEFRHRTDVVFKVQIASSKNSIPVKPENFKGVKDVEEEKMQDVYKYTVGRLNSFEEAVKLQRKIREDAYKDAFIIAEHNGERIPISKAIEMLQQ